MGSWGKRMPSLIDLKHSLQCQDTLCLCPHSCEVCCSGTRDCCTSLPFLAFLNGDLRAVFLSAWNIGCTEERVYSFWVCKLQCHTQLLLDEEKAAHLEHETTGGYLKTVGFKTACGLMWENMTDDEKESVKDIPNFDAEVFKEITGISVE